MCGYIRTAPSSRHQVSVYLPLDIKEYNNWANNARAGCHVEEFWLKNKVHVFMVAERKKVSRRCLHCYPAKLSIIQILFTASSSSLSSPSSPSLTAAHFELHGFVEYIFVYPVPGVFQEYACIIRQPLSKSHYSLISLVYLLWWSAQIDMTAE